MGAAFVIVARLTWRLKDSLFPSDGARIENGTVMATVGGLSGLNSGGRKSRRCSKCGYIANRYLLGPADDPSRIRTRVWGGEHQSTRIYAHSALRNIVFARRSGTVRRDWGSVELAGDWRGYSEVRCV